MYALIKKHEQKVSSRDIGAEFNRKCYLQGHSGSLLQRKVFAPKIQDTKIEQYKPSEQNQRKKPPYTKTDFEEIYKNNDKIIKEIIKEEENGEIGGNELTVSELERHLSNLFYFPYSKIETSFSGLRKNIVLGDLWAEHLTSEEGKSVMKMMCDTPVSSVSIYTAIKNLYEGAIAGRGYRASQFERDGNFTDACKAQKKRGQITKAADDFGNAMAEAAVGKLERKEVKKIEEALKGNIADMIQANMN